MATNIIASTPRSLSLLKQALHQGYSIDIINGRAYRPDGSEWMARANSRGYPSLQAKINGQHLHVPLHKAVAFVLWGDSAFGGPGVHVRHLDSNKANARGDNLAIGTARDNALDKPATQRSDASKKRALSIGERKTVRDVGPIQCYARKRGFGSVWKNWRSSVKKINA